MDHGRDAYAKLFEFFDKDLFLKIGMNDFIFIENSQIKTIWEKLKHDVFTNHETYVRKYGRDDTKNVWIHEFYLCLLGNSKIKIDPINNTKPTKLLEGSTLFSKGEKKGKTYIQNYQVSHLFGRTKNPLLFLCPWNLAYIPKYLDPFTGHESQGLLSEEFKLLIYKHLTDRFKPYIEDYNMIIEKLTSDKLEESLLHVRTTFRINENDFNTFSKNMKNEFSQIHIDI